MIHRLYVTSIVHYLNRNYTASYRVSNKILRHHKQALPLDPLAQLKRVLNHHNPNKFIGHVEADYRRQARTYDDHHSISKNTTKLDATLTKEECKNLAAAFLHWLEPFLPVLESHPVRHYLQRRQKLSSLA